MNGLFIPGITAEMFRNGCLESIDALMADGEIYDIDYSTWIPVSERLPEDYSRVLITINGCCGLIVREAKYHKTQNEFEVLHNYERWEVGEKGLLAWQPLPEPYKAESEEKENGRYI